jgi:hypothetical protein
LISADERGSTGLAIPSASPMLDRLILCANACHRWIGEIWRRGLQPLYRCSGKILASERGCKPLLHRRIHLMEDDKKRGGLADAPLGEVF